MKLPQYLHMPVQVLWFESDEVMIIMFGYLIGNLFGGLAWLAMILLPYPYILLKKNNPRGFLKHLIYMSGFFKIEGYPDYFAKRFHE